MLENSHRPQEMCTFHITRAASHAVVQSLIPGSDMNSYLICSGNTGLENH
jgi:hypothetical protein